MRGALVRNWLAVALGAVAGLVIAGALAAPPPRYVSEALVALAPEKTVAQFEPSITTSSSATQASGPERRQAIADLIVDEAVERDAIQRLNTTLPGAKFVPGQLIGTIQGLLRTNSDVITVRATAETSTEAVAIVNAWVESYIAYVNRLYLGSASTLDDLTAQRDAAQQQLAGAQADLENSLRSSRLESLNDAIKRDQNELTSLQPPSVTDAKGPSRDGYQFLDLQTINNLADTLRKIDAAEAAVQALSAGGDSQTTDATSSAAIAFLKAQLVAISGALPSNMQIAVPLASDGSDPTAVSTFAEQLRSVRAQVASELATRQASYEAASAAREDAIDSDLRVLRAQYQQASAERSALTNKRDLAQSTYTALSKKVEEQQIQQVDMGREVTLASTANAATLVLQSTVPARIFGAFAGAFAALVLAVGLRAATTRLLPMTPRQVSSEGVR